ncbi:unnamed protein product [Spirodela intermedia]|uniref:Uncharacterized protein n=1 Tax=Spirodela intermedia TaxID=51605 RepID=A0A7I8IUW1_SPIIN|nr:unnamed protein product [Spirodela intermedia]CAA6660771.1 unnamed protein product [Spirodela intermedia]
MPRQRKKKEHNEEIKKILQDVQISLPLLTAIEHIPEYARVLKEMCTPKRAPRVENYLCMLNALLDTGASINLLPASICDKFNISDLKPSTVTLQFADRSIKHPKGILENVIVTVKGCKFPTDFVVLEMDFNGQFYDTPIILGRPFLHTAKMNIDFPTGIEKFHVEINQIANPSSKSSPIDRRTSRRREEDDPPGDQSPPPENHLNLELKPLPSSLKYMFLEENNSFLIIIAADLSDEQEEELLDVLRKNKKAMGWKMDDLRALI